MRLKFAAVLPAFLLAVPAVLAQTESAEFTVGDIRIEGLQRITEGTVYNYLPVNIGDRLDERRVEEALRALYATGFFRDVEIRRDGGTLVVAVLERPSIESFTITGNKDIKTEDLEKSLRNVGLSRGKTFNQSTLDEVERFLTDQYFSRGKYAVQVDTKVEEVAGNRVKIAVDIVEGKRSKIRQINVVGNEAFSDDDLLADFKLRTPNWLSWYKQDDRYSREELSGDIEKLMNACAASGLGAPAAIAKLSIHSSVIGPGSTHCQRSLSLDSRMPRRASPFHACMSTCVPCGMAFVPG